MRALFALTALLLLVCLNGPAQAHAILDHTDPRVGATVAAPPQQVSLWFTQKIEPAFTNVEVRDASGERVDAGIVRVDPSNPALVHVPLKPLLPGTYKVHWRILSVDTHTTEGRFSFRVGK